MPHQIATITVLRNAADIVETFVRHHCALGVRMHIVLHRCIDNSEEILEKLKQEGLAVTLTFLDDFTFREEIILTKYARILAQDPSVHWILPLDVDAFFVSTDHVSIPECMAALPQDRVIALPHRTYVPTPEDDTAESCPVRRIIMRRSPEGTHARSVLIPASLVRGRQWSISAGCSAVIDDGTGDTLPMIASAALALAHFPIRSSDQCIGKILTSWISLHAEGTNEAPEPSPSVSLVNRCMTGNAFTPSELRNVALTYVAPEGASSLPSLVSDPIETTVTRPRYTIRSASPLAIVTDSARACVATTAEAVEPSDASAHPLEIFASRIARCIALLEHALTEEKSIQTHADPHTAAVAIVLTCIDAAILHEGAWTGSALTRRQTLGSLCPPLPADLQWIISLLTADKLPFTLERALMHVQSLVTREDFSVLRQYSRRESASDDVLAVIARSFAPATQSHTSGAVATFLAASIHHLLCTGITARGLSDCRVEILHPWCGNGEIALAALRRSVQSAVEHGANLDMLRQDLLTRIACIEHDATQRAIVSVRLSSLAKSLHIPLKNAERWPLYEKADQTPPKKHPHVPVIITALPLSWPEESTPDESVILRSYLRHSRRSGMERDAYLSASLRAMASIHTLLREAPISAAGILLPRRLLHEYSGAGMREALLMDFEQLHIVDLHGEGASPDDEAIDGSDGSGMALLFLLRNPTLRQGCHYASWRGLKMQKYHALLSRRIDRLPWQRIAPDAPGYVFLP